VCERHLRAVDAIVRHEQPAGQALFQLAAMGQTTQSPTRSALTDVIEAYERQRWPSGKIAGGKG
jgi:hypothetical protein